MVLLFKTLITKHSLKRKCHGQAFQFFCLKAWNTDSFCISLDVRYADLRISVQEFFFLLYLSSVSMC